MGMGRYVVDAVLLEGRSAREVARAHGISKTWIYELIRRYRAGGYEALEPRSRRPRSCKHETPPALIKAIVELRADALRASRPARRLPALLQPHPPTPGPSPTHAATGLQRPREGEARRLLGGHVLPRARGQGRQVRQGQPALRQPPLQNRARAGSQGPSDQATYRRREHPRDRLTGRADP